MKAMRKNRRMGHGKVSERGVAMNKIFAFLFIAIICVSFLPASVWASGDGSTDGSGGSRGEDTETTNEPIAASTGEYYFTKTLLSLDGLIPLDFTLEYSPHMNSMYYYGEFTLPPILPESRPVFASNTWIPLAKFDDTSTTPETEYINIQFLHDVLIFKKNAGVWESQMEVEYQFKETGNYFYMMDPTTELIYVFDKRHKVNWNWPPYFPPHIIKILGRVLYVMDRNGNKLTYSYNSDDQPTRIEDGLGRALILSYNAPTGYETYYLSEVKDSFDRTITLSYEEKEPSDWWYKHILKSITDPMGNTTQFGYQYDRNWDDSYIYMTKQMLPKGNIPYEQTWENKNLNGEQRFRVVSQRDAYGNQITLSFDGSSGIVTVTNSDGTQRVFEHESGRWFKSRTDETGKSFTMDHDASHRPTKLTDRFGDTTSLTYHPESGKIASITTAEGDTTNYTYTAQEQPFTNPVSGERFIFYNLNRIDYPDGTKEEFTYDVKGNMLTRVDRTGKIWSYTYNARGQVLTETNPEGGVTTYTYNADATLASSTDSDTGTTTYTYDDYKRLTRKNYPDGTFTQIAYNLNDQMTSFTNQKGIITNYEYDANGNLVRITRAFGTPAQQVTQLQYDEMDRLVKTIDPAGKETTFEYTWSDGLSTLTRRDGSRLSFRYDSRRWLIGVVDEIGKLWQVKRDEEAIVSKITTPMNHTIQLQSDKLGQIIGITDPLGENISLSRDSSGRITRYVDRMGREITIQRDGEGNIINITMPVIGTVIYDRNGLGLLTRITDNRGNYWDFGYTSMGWLNLTQDPLGRQWQYEHNNMAHISKMNYPDGIIENRTYDANGNLIKREFSDGLVIAYTYDELDRLTEESSIPISIAYDNRDGVINTTMSGASFEASYDDNEYLKTLTYDNRMTVTYYYDARGLLTRVEDDLSNSWINFTYNDDRFLIRIERSNGVTTEIERDAHDRIIGINHVGKGEQKFTLNVEGDITQIIEDLPIDVSTMLANELKKYLFDEANQITSVGFEYDARGRRTKDPERSYTWGSFDRLTGITKDGETVTLEYNGNGDLVKRTVNGITTEYFYNYAIRDHPVVAERINGDYTRFYIYTPRGRLLYFVDVPTKKPYFYHFNQIGSTLFLTDSTGAVTDAYGYTPFGRVVAHTGSSDQPFTFVGEYGVRQAGDTDLFHMRRRYYDAKTACFISRDPIWPDVFDPKSLNPNQYAAQNPLRFIDPRGEIRITPDATFASWEELKHGDVFVKVDEMTGQMKLYRIVRMSEKKEEEVKKEEVKKPIPKHIGNRATQKEKGVEVEYTFAPPPAPPSFFGPVIREGSPMDSCCSFVSHHGSYLSIIKADDPGTLNMNTIIHSPIFILGLLILFVWFITRKASSISLQKRKRKG